MKHTSKGAFHHYGALSKVGTIRMSQPLDAAWLRQLCLDAGADDVGFVEVDRPPLAEERLVFAEA